MVHQEWLAQYEQLVSDYWVVLHKGNANVPGKQGVGVPLEVLVSRQLKLMSVVEHEHQVREVFHVAAGLVAT